MHILVLQQVSKPMASIKEMDQNNWVCYKFGENSYYYGEVGLLDSSGVVHPKDNTQLAADPKVKLVKHGFGIFIYDDSSGESRYEGYWAKDKKNGKGLIKLKDGSVYDGQFKDGFYHDSGVMKWSNGNTYDGRWKKGRMQGPGIFNRKDGSSLKGSFKNNYFIDVNVLRNPFMSDSQYQQLKKRRKEIVKQYQKNQKIKSGYFQRVNVAQLNKVLPLIQKSTKNNRVALVVASQQSKTVFRNFSDAISDGGNAIHVIDLRKSFVLQAQQKYNYIKQIQQKSQKCLKDGGSLVLSLDDSEFVPQFEQLYYPQVRQLYSTNGFNSLFWAPRDLKKPEIRNKLIGNSQLSQKFNFSVWSKVKLSESLTNDYIRQKLQKRFESILPYIKIDVVFIQSGVKQQKQKQQLFN